MAQLALEWLQTTDANLRRGAETWAETRMDGRAEEWLGATGNDRSRMRALAARLEQMRNAFLDRAVAQYKQATPKLMTDATSSRTARVALALLGNPAAAAAEFEAALRLRPGSSEIAENLARARSAAQGSPP